MECIFRYIIQKSKDIILKLIKFDEKLPFYLNRDDMIIFFNEKKEIKTYVDVIKCSKKYEFIEF